MLISPVNRYTTQVQEKQGGPQKQSQRKPIKACLPRFLFLVRQLIFAEKNLIEKHCQEFNDNLQIV
jgi:hypothetical protein